MDPRSHRRRREAMTAVLVLAALAFSTEEATGAPESPRSLATELARLRSDIEELSGRLESQKSEASSQLQSLARQKAELDAQLRREGVRVAELQRRISNLKAKVATRAEAQEALRPLATSVADTLVAAIGKTLPFQRESRQKEIRGIVDHLATKRITPADAVARLWDRVEDELRLARESGLYSQVILLDGKEHLVEVARVGMVLMYFRTQDGRYGVAERRKEAWTFTLVGTEDKRKQISFLFESFRKQIRTGFFQLPGPMPAALGGRP